MAIQINSQFRIGTNKPLEEKMVVANIAARDAIPAGERYIGLETFVTSKGKKYKLLTGITNTDWLAEETFSLAEKEKLETIEENAQQNIVQGTYEELKALKDNNLLVKGYTYILTNYVTKYKQPISNVIMEGVSEELILTAISAGSFATECKSTVYKDDIVYYDFDNNICEDGITPRKGWITRRKDTILNNDIIGFDFRNCKFRRYKIDPVASGVVEWVYDDAHSRLDLVSDSGFLYVCIKDLVGNPDISNAEFWLQLFATNLKVLADVETTIYLGEDTVILTRSEELTDFVDSYMFDWTNAENKNNYVVANGLKNNVFFNNFRDNIFLKLANSNTSISTTTTNFVTNIFEQNIFISDFYNNKIYSQFSQNIKTSNGFSYNTIFGGFSYNTISSEFSYNTISRGFYSNTISSDGFYYNTISSEFSNNTISGGEFSNNTISGGGFYYNTISGRFIYNTISGGFSNNTISGGFIYNKISGGFIYNTISGGFIYNTISIGFSYNTISVGGFYYNTISGGFSYNTISIGFIYNDIKYLVNNIDFSFATHVAAYYNCEIGINSDYILYLSYIDADNIQQIVDVTD